MESFQPGDPVHVTGFGKGLVREVRNAGRYLVEVKGRAMEVLASNLTPLDTTGTRSGSEGFGRGGSSDPPGSVDRHTSTSRSGSRTEPVDTGSVVTLDLHGRTVDEALDLLDRALNDALLSNARELRVIHGRSGGRIKVAVHRRLGQLPSVRKFRVDPQNAGVTIVVL